jgi:hypothetical protein
MKTIVLATGVVALCVGSAQADVLFMAPGLSAAVANGTTAMTVDLTPSASTTDNPLKFVKYEITAIHYVIKANNPPAGSVRSNGNFIGPDVKNTLIVHLGDPESPILDKSLTASNEKDVLEGTITFNDPILIEEEEGISGVSFTIGQSYEGAEANTYHDDSYIVVEGSYSLDFGENSASVAQTDNTIMKHDSVCNMTWSIGTSPQGGPNNGFGNNADSIDPSNSNYVKMIGKWYPASSVSVSNGMIIVDDDEMQ